MGFIRKSFSVSRSKSDAYILVLKFWSLAVFPFLFKPLVMFWPANVPITGSVFTMSAM